MAKEEKKYSACDMIDLLRSRYPNGEYAFLEQVANGTGSGTNSWIDAAVFSLWPSKGIWRSAYEIKISRSDWLKELTNPVKNDWAREHFHFFWYVCAPNVAKEEELPEGCGLMVVRGNGLSIVRAAKRRENPKTDDEIIAAFARSMHKEIESYKRTELNDAIQNHGDYVDAKIWRDGCELYFKQKHTYFRPVTPQELSQKLMQVSIDPELKQEKQDADHIIKLLERLQYGVFSFIKTIVPMAGNLLNERDVLGQYIVETYGNDDEDSLETLKKILKDKSVRHKGDTSMKIKLKELIQNTDNCVDSEETIV